MKKPNRWVQGFACCLVAYIRKQGINDTYSDELFSEGIGTIEAAISEGVDEGDLEVLKQYYSHKSAAKPELVHDNGIHWELASHLQTSSHGSAVYTSTFMGVSVQREVYTRKKKNGDWGTSKETFYIGSEMQKYKTVDELMDAVMGKLKKS